MAICRKRPGRAALYTFSTSALGKMKAVSMMICVWPDRWLKGYLGNDRADAGGLAPGGDEAIADPEGS